MDSSTSSILSHLLRGIGRLHRSSKGKEGIVRALLLIAGTSVIGVTHVSYAAESGPGLPSVPASVAAVTSGGQWETKNERGRYRVIVEEGGWEHVISRVHIEWLAELSKEKKLAVVAAKMISELDGLWTFGPVKIIPSKKGTLLELPATDPHDGHQRKFLVELGPPGRYRIKP
jgi:hypothetical protein